MFDKEQFYQKQSFVDYIKEAKGLWKGVFKDFQEANGDKNVFNENIWITKQQVKVLDFLKNMQEPSKENIVVTPKYPLDVMAALILSEKNEVSILDFGGGMGLQYLDLINKIPKYNNIFYSIIEEKNVVKSVPEELQYFFNLSFYDDFSVVSKNFDILFMGGVLQYIEDWKNLLKILVKKTNSKYLIFGDLLIGDIPSFVTHQLFYGKKISVHMINKIIFMDFLNELGFEPIYFSNFDSIYFINNELPNDLLPISHKIKKSINIIFKKKEN